MYDEFSFESNPRFIFHDSPGFEAGGDQELQEVLSFLQEKAKVTDVKDQIHAIWCVLLFAYPPFIWRNRQYVQVLFHSGRISPVIGIGTEVFQ